MLEPLLSEHYQSRSRSFLDSLLSDEFLPKAVKNYLITCRVEGKSPRTMEAYSMVLRRFCRDFDTTAATAADVRLFLLKLQELGLKPAGILIFFRNNFVSLSKRRIPFN